MLVVHDHNTALPRHVLHMDDDDVALYINKLWFCSWAPPSIRKHNTLTYVAVTPQPESLLQR